MSYLPSIRVSPQEVFSYKMLLLEYQFYHWMTVNAVPNTIYCASHHYWTTNKNNIQTCTCIWKAHTIYWIKYMTWNTLHVIAFDVDPFIFVIIHLFPFKYFLLIVIKPLQRFSRVNDKYQVLKELPTNRGPIKVQQDRFWCGK